MTPGELILFLLFGVIALLSFGCQIYVSSRVFKEQGTFAIIWGCLRGTKTFIRGWREAEALGIKDIMIFWSILVGIILLAVCVLMLLVLVNGPPS